MRVLFFMPNLAGGGAERVTLQLCQGLVDAGVQVTLVLGSTEGQLQASLPPALDVVNLRSRGTLASIPRLTRVLRRRSFDAHVGVLTHANLVLAAAHRFARCQVPLILMQHNVMSAEADAAAGLRERLLPWLASRLYPQADIVCAVSVGVGTDLVTRLGLDPARVIVLNNPIDYDRILELGRESPPPGAIPAGEGPMICAIGRLEPQKDFPTLLDALSRTPGSFRLVILGEGSQRSQLEEQIERLDLRQRVSLPGFIENPYAVLSRCDVFALSSRFEGLPTVLLEAIAFPIHIVSTDCEAGPREILEGGQLGRLVPVGSAAAMSEALRQVVGAQVPDRSASTQRYRTENIAREFITLVDSLR